MTQKEKEELGALNNFLKLRGIMIPPDQINGPRKTFPDFIIQLSEKSINVEITRAPTNEERMQGLNDMDKFREYISQILNQLNIEGNFAMPDGPILFSIDAYQHREAIAAWIQKNHKAIPVTELIGNITIEVNNVITAQFGDCIVELRCENGKKVFGYSWQNAGPYCPNSEVIEMYCRNIAGNIISAIKQKIKKYERQNVRADWFIIEPVYWEPIISSNKEEMSESMIIAKQEISRNQFNGISLIEQIPKYFEEIWILMPHSTFRIFPV